MVELEDLRSLVAVADGETVADIAAAAGVSQPAVTRALQRLSVEAGAPLTERWGRRLRLTAAGLVLTEAARRIVADADAALAAVAESWDPDAGTIRFGFLSPLGAWLVPELLLGFRTARPRVGFELRHDGATRILQALLTGELDLLLISEPSDPRVSWERLFDEELVLSVPAAHPLARRSSVRVEELADEAWVLLSPGYGLRQRAEELCASAGFAPTVAFEGHDLATLHALIGAGSGVGLFPTLPKPPPAVRQVHLRPRLRRNIGLARLGDRLLSPSGLAFAEHVRASAAGVAV